MSLPEENIERALITRAKLYTDIPVMFPNESEIPPSDGSSHAIVRHFRNGSENFHLDEDGQDYNLGILQFLIRCPLNEGPGEIRKRGSDIIALFPKYDILESEGTRVRISKRPVLGTAAPTDAWYEATVRIPYEAFI